jgi:RNA polymerase sigma-B factor
MKAALRYRSDLGHGFVPYALPTITGELKRYLRDQAWMVRPPRAVLDLRLKVKEARGRLTQELGHEPTTAEISRDLGVAEVSVAEALIADSALIVETIEDTDGGETDGDRPPTAVLAWTDPAFEHFETLQALAIALESVSEQDRLLVRLRFGQELSQCEIARHLGVSQMQVSRLLRRVLARLRRRLAA